MKLTHLQFLLVLFSSLLQIQKMPCAQQIQQLPALENRIFKNIQEQRKHNLHLETHSLESWSPEVLPKFFILKKTKNNRIEKKIRLTPKMIFQKIQTLNPSSPTLKRPKKIQRAQPYQGPQLHTIQKLFTAFLLVKNSNKHTLMYQSKLNQIIPAHDIAFFISQLNEASEQKLPDEFIRQYISIIFEKNKQNQALNQALDKESLFKQILQHSPKQIQKKCFCLDKEKLGLNPKDNLILEQVQKQGARTKLFLQNYGQGTLLLLQRSPQCHWIEKEKHLPEEIIEYFPCDHYSISPNNKFGLCFDAEASGIIPFACCENPVPLASKISLTTLHVKPEEILQVIWASDNTHVLIVTKKTTCLLNFLYEKEEELDKLNVLNVSCVEIPFNAAQTGHSLSSNPLEVILSEEKEESGEGFIKTYRILPDALTTTANVSIKKYSPYDRLFSFSENSIHLAWNNELKKGVLRHNEKMFSLSTERTIVNAAASNSGAFIALLTYQLTNNQYYIEILGQNPIFNEPWSISQIIPLNQEKQDKDEAKTALLITQDERKIFIQINDAIYQCSEQTINSPLQDYLKELYTGPHLS